jgi:hypothetical protein
MLDSAFLDSFLGRAACGQFRNITIKIRRIYQGADDELVMVGVDSFGLPSIRDPEAKFENVDKAVVSFLRMRGTINAFTMPLQKWQEIVSAAAKNVVDSAQPHVG